MDTDYETTTTIVDSSCGTSEGLATSDEVYLLSASSGDLLHTIPSPAAGVNDFFGWDVAADGNKVLVGAWGDDTAGDGEGAAYLFDAATGELLQTFLSPMPDQTVSFGFSLAIRGKNVLVRSIGAGAYLFDAITGQLLDSFLNPMLTAAGSFGLEVGFLDDTHVIVSDPRDDTGAEDSGAVYVFEITPIPEPSAILLIVYAATALLARGWRER